MAAIDHAGETSPELENAIEASSIQAFAFDFDLTLSNIHVYNQRVAPAHVHYRWRDDIPCPEELSAILRAISAAGRSWCVVTFGQPPVVTAYLEALGFTKEEISVHSPLSGNQRYSETLSPPADKNVFLKAIAASANVSEERVVLFDDDHRNVAAAVKAGFMGAVVNPGEGMSTGRFIEYLEQAVARAPVKKKA